MSDHRSLVDGASRGDPSALGDLLIRHLPRLRAFVRLRTSSALRARESCSDLVQSVCREVVAKMDRFEYRGEAAFRGWLFTKALSKIQARTRYHTAQKRDAADVVNLDDALPDYARHYDAVATPSQVAMGREELARLEAAFDELPDDYREVLTLARIAGMSVGEIAAETGRSEGSVRGLLQRGLTRLAWILGRDAVEG